MVSARCGYVHLRRANRPPLVEEFACGGDSFLSTSLWVAARFLF